MPRLTARRIPYTARGTARRGAKYKKLKILFFLDIQDIY